MGTARRRALPRSGLLGKLRPADGWVSLLFLAANLCVVVLSVERADWAPTPSLVGVLLTAMLTAFVFHRLPIWWWLAILPGIAIGALTIVWQMTTYSFDGEQLGTAAALWERLTLWGEAAQEGSINIDEVPFSFGMVTASWLTGYLGGWLFLRHRNFWGVFVLGGLGLLSNLTFLPPNTNVHLAMYLFTALLLVARVQAVRRQGEWDRRGVHYDEGLRSLTLGDSFFIAIAILAIAFLLPIWGAWKPVTNAYESMRHPLIGLEDDFNRLFAGLPARRAIGFRVWDDVMAFQGTINPAKTTVLHVDSPAPLYWKARTYSTYTSKGWLSEESEYVPLGELPGVDTMPDAGERESRSPTRRCPCTHRKCCSPADASWGWTATRRLRSRWFPTRRPRESWCRECPTKGCARCWNRCSESKNSVTPPSGTGCGACRCRAACR